MLKTALRDHCCFHHKLYMNSRTARHRRGFTNEYHEPYTTPNQSNHNTYTMREGSKLKYQWSSICVLQKQQEVDADLVLQ